MMTDIHRPEKNAYDRETDALVAFLADDTSTTWMDLGACRSGVDPNLFSPVARQAMVDGELIDIEPDYPSDEVKAICDRCPVKDICLSWALKNRVEGIWGGTTTYQRELMLRRRARKYCPGCTSQTVIMSGRNQLCLSCGISWPA